MLLAWGNSWKPSAWTSAAWVVITQDGTAWEPIIGYAPRAVAVSPIFVAAARGPRLEAIGVASFSVATESPRYTSQWIGPALGLEDEPEFEPRVFSLTPTPGCSRVSGLSVKAESKRYASDNLSPRYSVELA